MKKFLTVLLALSVVFTYSFSAVGTAFAVTDDGKYTSADYSKYLNDEWDNYYSPKLAVAERDYAKTFTFSGDTTLYGTSVEASDLGLKAVDPNSGSWTTPWTEIALKDFQPQLREDVVTAKNKYISQQIETAFASDQYITIAPADANISLRDAEVDKNVTLDNILAPNGYSTFADANEDRFYAAQAKNIYDAAIAKINATSEENYSAENANKIAAEKAKAVSAIEAIKTSTAEDKDTDAEKAEEYVKAFAAFKTATDLPTLDDEGLNDANNAATVAAAVADYVEYALDETYTVFSLKAGNPVPAAYTSVTGIDKAVYEAGANRTAKIFGVAIANTDKVTAAEASAANKAFREAVVGSADIVAAYANALDVKTTAARVAAVVSLYNNANGGSTYECLRTINKAMNAADVYAEVVAEGKLMKETTRYGIKVYDDEKVDQAVKEAEELVYADLKNGFKEAKDYITAAAKKGDYSLYAENFEYESFMKAIDNAQAKFFKADGTPQVKVLYGDNKTAEADYVYLKSTYATVEAPAWNTIARGAVDDLEIAESYAEIDEILADTAAAMSELMLAKDEAAVVASINRHKAALAESLDEAMKIMGTTDYLEASFNDAYEAGLDLIDAADTLEEVSAAYTQAEALIRNIPTKAELNTALTNLIAKIDALPSTSALTAADKDTVVAVLDAYVDYAEMFGSDVTKITNTYTFNADLDAVLRLVHKDLKEKVDATVKTINNCNPSTDNGAATLVSMKSNIIALLGEIGDFNGLLDAVDGVESLSRFVATDELAIDDSVLAGTLNAENAIWKAELHVLLKQANTAKTIAEKEAVIDAYAALTDRQQYKIEQNLKILIEEIKAELVSAVESLKITASSAAKKGSITVKWTVKGDAAVADGYQVYRSVKKNSGFGTKPIFKTTKKSYKNTKSLKKGTRYYYKVRAYKVIDGKTYYSDWSNKAYRIAK